jgi:peptidoglycan/LPS O-acetylase OafA/YrhL
MYWFVWALGAIVAEAYAGRIKVRWLPALALAGGLGLIVLMVLMNRFVSLPGWWRFYDLAWGIGLAALLAYVLMACPGWLTTTLNNAGHRLSWLGNISYSLYVVHLPWLVLLGSWWQLQFGAIPTSGELASAELAILGVVSALALAWLAWYLVERHCVSRPTHTTSKYPQIQLAATQAGARIP